VSPLSRKSRSYNSQPPSRSRALNFSHPPLAVQFDGLHFLFLFFFRFLVVAGGGEYLLSLNLQPDSPPEPHLFVLPSFMQIL